MGEHDKFDLTIVDTIGAGFTFDAALPSLSIMLGGNTVSAGVVEVPLVRGTHYTVNVTGSEITFDFDLIRLKNLLNTMVINGNAVYYRYAPITIVYSAILNGTVVSGANGNPNKVTGTYENDDGEGEIPEVEVKVFTFYIDIDKFTPSANGPVSLEGVGFTLYGNAGLTEVVRAQALTGVDGKLRFDGLKPGVYWLAETAPLPGYNRIDAIEVTITLDGVAGTRWGHVWLTAEYTVEYPTATGTGEGTIPVENRRGIQFPETGGIGTVLFYIIGTLVTLSAGVALIVRSKMAKKRENGSVI
jgi:LPXTG-motif cell wall-anchored protein